MFVSLIVDCDIAPAHGGDPVFANGKQIGSVTSGGYGFLVQQNIAYAFIEPEQADIGNQLQVGILGTQYPAVVVNPVIYDPDNKQARS